MQEDEHESRDLADEGRGDGGEGLFTECLFLPFCLMLNEGDSLFGLLLELLSSELNIESRLFESIVKVSVKLEKVPVNSTLDFLD